MGCPVFVKDPSAKLDYSFNWSDWLVGGDTIQASEWVISPPGLKDEDPDHSASISIVWLSEGTVGEQYRVTNRITTTGGRVDDRTIMIVIKER